MRGNFNNMKLKKSTSSIFFLSGLLVLIGILDSLTCLSVLALPLMEIQLLVNFNNLPFELHRKHSIKIKISTRS